jgi:MFS transporter, ACS family, allantoate permease
MSLIIFLAVGIYTRKVPNRRLYIMAAATIPPFVGMLGMSLLPNTPEYKWTKWGMYFMTVPFVLAMFLAWTLSKHHLLLATLTRLTYISSPIKRRRPHEEDHHLLRHLPRLLRRQHVRQPNLQIC